MARSSLPLLALLVLALGITAGAADAPAVQTAIPANGAVEVSPDIGRVMLIFDRAMEDSAAMVEPLADHEPLPVAGRSEWVSDRILKIPLDPLVPGRTYGFRLNDRLSTVRSAEGEALPTLTWRFTVALPVGEGPPRVVRTVPPAGAEAVDPALDRIEVYFSEDMAAGGMSVVGHPDLPLPPLDEKSPPRFLGPRCFVLPVRLLPGQRYGLVLNGGRRRNFVSAGTGTPLEPYELTFKTARPAERTAPPEPAAEPLPEAFVGTFTGANDTMRMRLDVRPDGTFVLLGASSQVGQVGEGRLRHESDTRLRLQGGKNSSIFRVRRAAPDLLDLELGGIFHRFRRPGEVEGLNGTWRSDPENAFPLTFSGKKELRMGPPGEEIAGVYALAGPRLIFQVEAEAPEEVFLVADEDGTLSFTGGPDVLLTRAEGAPEQIPMPLPGGSNGVNDSSSLYARWVGEGELGPVTLVLAEDRPSRLVYEGLAGGEFVGRGWRTDGDVIEIYGVSDSQERFRYHRLGIGFLEIWIESPSGPGPVILHRAGLPPADPPAEAPAEPDEEEIDEIRFAITRFRDWKDLCERRRDDLSSFGRRAWSVLEVPGFTYSDTAWFIGGDISCTVIIVTHDRSGLEFSLIPGGRFRMGRLDGEDEEAGPVREVLVRPFLLARTELTRAAWDRVAKPLGGPFDAPALPVVGVTWKAATAWCVEAGLRLPSEAEWEYACRAGEEGDYTSGPHTSALEDHAFTSNSEIDGPMETGLLLPNSFGLHDVHGNAGEWCADAWHPNYEGAPGMAWAWVEDGDAVHRVWRGGTYRTVPFFACSWTRDRQAMEEGRDDLGFRPAADLEIPE